MEIDSEEAAGSATGVADSEEEGETIGGVDGGETVNILTSFLLNEEPVLRKLSRFKGLIKRFSDSPEWKHDMFGKEGERRDDDRGFDRGGFGGRGRGRGGFGRDRGFGGRDRDGGFGRDREFGRDRGFGRNRDR